MRYLKNEELLRVIFLLTIIFILYNFTFLPLGAFKGPALLTEDFFTNLALNRKPLPPELEDMVVVAVDSQSIRQDGLRWPWRRSLFADLIKKISQGKPKAIFLDFVFAVKSGDEGEDLLFAEEIKKANNVILAGYIEEGELIKPRELLASSCRGVGFVNKAPEARDLMATRNAWLIFPVSSEQAGFDYSAETKILALAKGIPLTDIRYDGNKVILSPGLSFGLDAHAAVPINYAVPFTAFTSIPAYKILGGQSGFDPSAFKDKIVLVGITAPISQDIHMTPVGRLSGIYINAYTLLMFLSGNLIRAFPFWLDKIILLVCVFALGPLSFRLKGMYPALTLLCFTLAAGAAYLFLRIHSHLTLDIFSLLFLPVVSCVAVEVYKYAKLLVESQALKRMVIFEPATATHAPRYFQVSIRHALMREGRRPEHFFCLVRINDFERLKQKCAHRITSVIKMLSEAIHTRIGKNSLIARSGEGGFSLCLWNAKRKAIEKLLLQLCLELEKREFIVDKEQLRLSIKIAAVDFPRENIKRYEDLALTCESLLKRIGDNSPAPLAIFNPETDKLIISGEAGEAAAGIPQDELSYVRMDVEGRAKELEAAVERLTEQQKKIEEHYLHTMRSLVAALESKDRYTQGHSDRVAFYATELAKGMALPPQEIDAVNKAAYLHDIGKIGLPDRILHKSERLTEDEFEIVKRHLSDGVKILEGLPFCDQLEKYILYHHERYDGKGYPYGLSGEMIPAGAQIIAISDAFDAMTTGRGYNEPLGVSRAIEELKKCSGTQFSPACVKVFVELLEGKKIYALSKTPLQPHL